MLHADSSHSSSSTKGERLSAKMRSLPSSSEPYETSSPKELGERAALLSSPPPHLSHQRLINICPAQMRRTWTPWGPRRSGPRPGPRSAWRRTSLRTKSWETTCCRSRRLFWAFRPWLDISHCCRLQKTISNKQTNKTKLNVKDGAVRLLW